jgi:hypothetical protein
MTRLWNLPEFRSGLEFGGVATLALLLMGVAASTRARRQPFPLGGAVIAVGALWSIAANRHVPAVVLVGVIAIGAVAALSHAPPVSRWHCILLAVPFACLIGFQGELLTAIWARALVSGAIAAGSMLVADFDDTWHVETVGLTLFAVSALGVYVTVPDTELVGAVLGASLPLLLLGWPVRVASLGRVGGAAATALLLWAGAAGGGGRPASIVAVVVCLGLLVGAPIGAMLLPRAAGTLRRVPPARLLLALVASHAVIVVTAARVAGQWTDPLVATALGAFVGVAAVLIGALFRPPSHAVAPAGVD